ncbi:response regulator transcription factor [Aneurinibacillus sp. Ricciae_BoGa-3]|uniref:response regulator transcription factor n=1 Tax=Aneurinibacillus sp. Ricciae_BoGa-3 TaxID=3022697 RepID=UPI00233FA43A|nr:response regulator transcription factor [Aneurinibacillus sp. Ricciae_BoGa-3]WCK54843.1 response regulator transcription factor [Aneurinibacillus sp. Ricciae_BoGa-3]
MIVDNEKPMQQLLSICLRQAGYRTDRASSGEEAIEKIERDTYILILLDVMMPVMDLARVQAVVRRTTSKNNQQAKNDELLLTHQGITLHSYQREAFFDNQLLSLTPKEYEILYILLKSPRRIFSREDLLALIWGEQNIEDERTVDTHVKNLREKLRAKGAPAHNIIKTVWGVGYKLQ